MRIVLAGGTGFIGRALKQKLLSAGHEVVVLTRKSSAGAKARESFVAWDGRNTGEWAASLDGADAVINLSGENIAAKRWTPEQKQKILASRVDATRAIVNAIGLARQKPALLINASAVGYYGDAGNRELTEARARGAGFLAETCESWETEARKAERLGVRVILARLGPVLGEKGGMLSKMLPPFRFFLGAPLGTGKQWISWVHQEDVTGALLFMLEQGDLSGPVNVTSGVPATMKDFCRTLAKILSRPSWPPVPSIFLKMLMGEMATIILASQKVLPLRLLEAGYHFRYPDLSAAFAAILKENA
ncbi:MAG: TIGR01777 family oxidoreductase [Candidatus Omnitrophota bacterium]